MATGAIQMDFTAEEEEGLYDELTGPASSAKDAPVYGLLSKTLIHSPVVKKILPARIRRQDLNDVVFIGETFIELHLLTTQGKLQKVGFKTDIGAEIRDACVFGTKWPIQFPTAAPSAGPGVGGRDPNEDLKSRLPAEILAMTTDTGYLQFVYARDCDEQGQVDFVVSKRRIDNRGVHPSHLGKGMAVDPQSRAMAVAAYQDRFRVYALHSMEDMQRQMAEGVPLNPIKEERTFAVDGCFIAHMEFLYTSDNEQVVILIFLIDAESKSRLQLYEWYTNRSLRTTVKQGEQGLRVSDDISMPLHVIPLVISSAFLIVTEYSTYVGRASDILNGIVSFRNVAFPSNDQQGLVTAWSRPYRHPNYTGTLDAIYLAMENGGIYYLEVDGSVNALVQNVVKASYLDCAIGTAFTALDYGLRSNDMIVAGGEMSSGGIYLLPIAAWPVDSRAELEETVINWAPVLDFELVDLSTRGQGNGAKRDRVLACAGRGKHGAITELRYGIQATAQTPVDYVPGVRRLFVLPDATRRTDKHKGGCFVLSSQFGESFLCFRSAGKEGDWFECQMEITFEFDEPTLAAGPLEATDDWPWSVQVTPTMITVVQLAQGDAQRGGDADTDMDGNPQMRRLQRTCEPGETITAAALHGKFIAIALRCRVSVSLVLASMEIPPDSPESGEFLVAVGAPVALEDDPTSMDFLELNGRLMVAMGTRKATVQIFTCDGAEGLHPFAERELLENAPADGLHDLGLCESTVLISTNTAAKLLCGLRGGSVVVFDFVVSGSSVHLKRRQEVTFGPIPVLLSADVYRKDSAFALAGRELYRFDMPRDNFRGAQVIVVMPNEDIDPNIEAIVQVGDQALGSENTLICFADDQIFCADIGQSGKICGRRLRLNATPRRLLFYERMNCYIVACGRNPNHMEVSGNPATELCTLKVIDARTGQSCLPDGPLRDKKKEELIFSKPNEQIYCLAEWNMNLGDVHHHFIAVGTGATSDGVSFGRLVILTLHREDDGTVAVRRVCPMDCDDTVYSVAPYGTSSLVYCTGMNLYFKDFNAQTKRLDLVAQVKLRSPVVQISVSEPLICVSCAMDSVLVIKYDSGTMYECFSDEIARNGFSLTKLLENLLIATDKQYGVVGLWRPPNDRALQSLRTVFEAELSSSISRIRRGVCRPPWVPHDRHLPGTVGGASNLIAAGVDGSFFQLTVVEEDALRLLQLIQELYRTRHRAKETSMLLASVVGGVPAREWDPTTAHINGDALAPVVELGATWLRDVMTKLDSTAREGFIALARRTVKPTGGEDVCEAVMVWLDGLLNDAVL